MNTTLHFVTFCAILFFGQHLPFPLPPQVLCQVKAEVLLNHPQIERLTAEVLAKFGAPGAMGATKAFSTAFWRWLPHAVQRQRCPELPDPPQSEVSVGEKLRSLYTPTPPTIGLHGRGCIKWDAG